MIDLILSIGDYVIKWGTQKAIDIIIMCSFKRFPIMIIALLFFSSFLVYDVRLRVQVFFFYKALTSLIPFVGSCPQRSIGLEWVSDFWGQFLAWTKSKCLSHKCRTKRLWQYVDFMHAQIPPIIFIYLFEWILNENFEIIIIFFSNSQ
jgi:hypothetical protein